MMNQPAHNPHLIWISPLFWMVVIYGSYLAYSSGYKRVVVSLRSGKLKALGKTYKLSAQPLIFWLNLAWNSFIALAGSMVAAAMIWAALSADIMLSVIAFVFFCCVLTLSELLYRFVLRALLTGVMPGKACFYRRDRQPKRYWASILFQLFVFLMFFSVLTLLTVTRWVVGHQA